MTSTPSETDTCPPALRSAYATAKRAVIEAGYGPEIDWQRSLNFKDVTESDLLREHAWVVLSCGMRESVVRRKFPAISGCFENWESAEMIATRACLCRQRALAHFNHPGKIDAMIRAAETIASEGFGRLKALIARSPLRELRRLGYIGPVTVYHLAKNLGLPVCKPDRHLVRLAEAVGRGDVQALCADVSDQSGDPIPVVDIVLWRFATLYPSYVELFTRYLSASTPGQEGSPTTRT